MLNISFKVTNKTIWDVDSYFNFNYEDAWFENDLVKEMVRDIDKSDVVSSNCVQSPVLGQIPVTKLSGGVKALILMLKEPELWIYATACGDNCANWIVRISEMQDVNIVLRHTMWFTRDFVGKCIDNGMRIHNLDDYGRCLIECL